MLTYFVVAADERVVRHRPEIAHCMLQLPSFIRQDPSCFVDEDFLRSLNRHGEIVKMLKEIVGQLSRCNGIAIRHHLDYRFVGRMPDAGNDRYRKQSYFPGKPVIVET